MKVLFKLLSRAWEYLRQIINKYEVSFAFPLFVWISRLQIIICLSTAAVSQWPRSNQTLSCGWHQVTSWHLAFTMWREKYLAELKRSVMLKNACTDLREEFDEFNTERLAMVGRKFFPKYSDAREFPSKKVKSFSLSVFTAIKCTFRQVTKLMLSRCSTKYFAQLSG